jgi:hypothetical protein
MASRPPTISSTGIVSRLKAASSNIGFLPMRGLKCSLKRKLILSLPMPLGLSSTTDMVTPKFINSRIRDHVLRNAEPLYVAA